MTHQSIRTDSRPIRVLYIDTGVWLAGGQIQLIEILKLLDRSAVLPVVTSPPGSAVAAFCLRSGIPWLPLPFASAHLSRGGPPRGLARLTDLARAAYGVAVLARHARRTGADILHANTFKAGLVCAAASLFTRTPMVFHDRTLFGHMPAGWLVGLRARRIIVISRAVAAKYRGRLSGRLRLIPDGVDTERFSPAEPGPRPASVVGYLGRISREKGAVHLLRAAPLVLGRAPGARFRIGGSAFTRDGQAYLKELQAEVGRLGLGRNVEFVGQVKDAVGFLRGVDILALPSEAEGLGVVMLEAMAVGKPVVAFASGGPAEVISCGRDGLLVGPGDVPGLADAIARVLTEPGLAESLGRAARRTVTERHSSAATAAKLMDTYREVRADRARTGASYAAVAALLRILAPVRRRCSLGEVRKILVIGSGGIGDVVMKAPLFACLRRGFPRAEIVFFTSSGPEREIIRGHPGADRLIILEEREALTPRHPREMLRYLRRLRAERFDVTITTHYGISLKGAVFSYFLGAPIRVGFNKGGRGTLYTHRVEVEDVEARHAVDWNLDLAERLGIKVDSRDPALCLTPEDRRFAADFLAQAGLGKDQVVIALFQGSKRRSRLWPGDRFAHLADALVGRYRSRILLLGGERERPAVGAIAGAMRAAPMVAVGQSIRQTAALIERSGLVVSCDSGPMHIAAALKTPVVALFGPETPVRVGPRGKKSAVIRHDLPCSPCHDMDCRFGSPRCMEMITAEEVLLTIDKHSAEWGLDVFRKLDPRS